jgi:hypothetical protein
VIVFRDFQVRGLGRTAGRYGSCESLSGNWKNVLWKGIDISVTLPMGFLAIRIIEYYGGEM